MARSEYGRARDRKARRQGEAQARNDLYQELSLHDRLVQQLPYRGKQFRKLAKRIEKDENGCYTMPDGECIAPGECIHTVKG